MPADTMPQTPHVAQRSFSSDDIAAASQNYSSLHQPPSQPVQPYRSLRTRRAQQSLTLPIHFRRRAGMEEEPWIQSISDIEDGSHLNRYFLQNSSRSEMPSTDHAQSYHQKTPQSTPSLSAPNNTYNGSQLPPLSSSSSYESSVWTSQASQLSLNGLPSGPMSSAWPQGNYASFMPDSSLSLPSTPAAVGLYQSQFHDQNGRQMPHLNTPPTSAASFARVGSSGGRPQLKVNTGSHGYFKENASPIMTKFFGSNANPIAPPQMYNVPPPASLSSNESFNDGPSMPFSRRINSSALRLHPASSDLSSQPSLDYSKQSPRGEAPLRKRLPTNVSESPAGMYSGSNASPSGNTSAAASLYESDSNYAASSAHSSYPSRLPSPTESESQRNAQDRFLVECRSKGMSYKEIRRRGGFSEAESTLRGRHRMLTKNKESRVRKPEWTETDIELLKEAMRPVSRGIARGGKTSWKAVAQYIAKNGGSYSFGYATCHNKWKEIVAAQRQRR